MFLWLETEILQMGDGEYSVLLAFLIGVIIFLAYITHTALKRYRFMSGTATSKIRSAPQGYVELKGTGQLMPGDEIRSPFSGNRCLWYQCTVEQKKKNGKHANWINISDEMSNNLFHLLDETGECVIDPESAHVVPGLSRTWYGHDLQDRLRPSVAGGLFVGIATGGYRFSEKIIRPASQLYALGNFRTEQHTADPATIETLVQELIRQWKLQPHRYLAEFDFDVSGKLNKQQWRTIQHKARLQVIGGIQQQSHNILARPQQAGKPFIISATEEEGLVARKKILSVSAVAIAFLLFIITINIMVVRPPY